MPRFNDAEKERIQSLLLTEGEKLFTSHGLKKVTIDDIVAAVRIAKATFYKFYEGKEYLFLDIAQKKQAEIFKRLSKVVETNSKKEPVIRVKEVFFSMSQMMLEYPILSIIDKDTTEIILRKVSQERLSQFLSQGVDAVDILISHGIHFKVAPDIVSGLFNSLYQAFIGLKDESPDKTQQIINIMLDGILSQIL